MNTQSSHSNAIKPAPDAAVDLSDGGTPGTATPAMDAIPAQDLTPDQLDAIKGGPFGSFRLNHNETAASDSEAPHCARRKCVHDRRSRKRHG